MADEPRKFDPFKPAQPRIPGVGDTPAAPAPAPAAAKPAPRVQLTPRLIAIGAGSAVVLGILLAAVFLRPSAPSAPPVEQPAAPAPASATPQSPAANAASSPATAKAEIPPIYSDEVAAISEMDKPWSSRRFNFLKKVSMGPVPAMLVRLPGGSARNADSYWAFALKSRYGKCDLELVTDLEKLRADFGYRAQHPMVAEPCTGTVFDPLQRSTVSGAWVRGAVVQGASMRPPFMIEVQIKGDRILAVQME